MDKPWKYSNTEALLVNRLAREQFKRKMLADIVADMQVCLLEGVDPYEYVDELISELQNIKAKFKHKGGKV